MKQGLLTGGNDSAWALEKAGLGIIPAGVFPGSCMVTGNEDAPDKLEFYQSANPTTTDVPYVVVGFGALKTEANGNAVAYGDVDMPGFANGFE